METFCGVNCVFWLVNVWSVKTTMETEGKQTLDYMIMCGYVGGNIVLITLDCDRSDLLKANAQKEMCLHMCYNFVCGDAILIWTWLL